MGAGEYNLETAEAAAINTNTVMRWNEYLYQAQQAANYRAHMRIKERAEKDKEAYDATVGRLRENPTPNEIANGDAMNALLDQISDPRVHASSLRLATEKIPGKVVRAIPFVHASEAVSLSLDQLTSDDSWPAALLDSKFNEDRKAYAAAVDKALEEDKEGVISPESQQKLQDVLRRFRAKLVANPPSEKARYDEATQYLKTLAGMTRLLQKPEIEKIVSEIDKIKETTLGNLMGFMQNFNLRFGPAVTPEQKAAYEHLYPMMSQLRDRVLKDAKADAKATRPKPERPTDFFRGMHLDHREKENKKSDNK